MENQDGHEGAQANQPSSPTSGRRRREEEGSIQSNQRRPVDETSTTEDNGSSSGIGQENREIIAQAFLRWARQMGEDAIHKSDNDDDDDDDESEEEESSVSNGNNSSSTSFSLEETESYVEEALQIAGQMDVMQNQMDEEESSVSNEGWNLNQSNQRRRVDETSATEDGNNNNNNNNSNSSSLRSFSQEEFERLVERAFQNVRRAEDAMQNQQGRVQIFVVGEFRIDNEDGSVRTTPYVVTLALLNSNVGFLDIDGMSYEELTELEERIGMAKRGISEEIILKQLKSRVHTTSADSTEDETEICIVCQDKYENQDKIATLDCKHEYHQDCITKWLVRKNVCPICNRQALMEESKGEEMNEC
ncbi:E3 ubiquitin-protein ligase CIP8-like [Papaver somniferum]|uniref:E3 ubiquitin-protein ligase CIP8-like n=1 Tax=Papaver somniferum TaxID=3469 RepID=UPI000E702B26|nr:E3 ubiquitin-protein ligase CIP8-like [Papaver somniferum]